MFDDCAKNSTLNTVIQLQFSRPLLRKITTGAAQKDSKHDQPTLLNALTHLPGKTLDVYVCHYKLQYQCPLCNLVRKQSLHVGKA